MTPRPILIAALGRGMKDSVTPAKGTIAAGRRAGELAAKYQHLGLDVTVLALGAHSALDIVVPAATEASTMVSYIAGSSPELEGKILQGGGTSVVANFGELARIAKSLKPSRIIVVYTPLTRFRTSLTGRFVLPLDTRVQYNLSGYVFNTAWEAIGLVLTETVTTIATVWAMLGVGHGDWQTLERKFLRMFKPRSWFVRATKRVVYHDI